MKDKWYYKYGWTILEGEQKEKSYQHCLEASVLLVERANLEFDSLLRCFRRAEERFVRKVYAIALSRREELSNYQDEMTMQQMIDCLSLENMVPLMKHENPMITAMAFQKAMEQVDRGKDYLTYPYQNRKRRRR